MAIRQPKIKIFATQIGYIDPGHCASTIGYKITKRRRYLRGDIQLSDCNRIIEWGFSDFPSSVKKIDTVIQILQNFRRDFIIARHNKNKK